MPIKFIVKILLINCIINPINYCSSNQEALSMNYSEFSFILKPSPLGGIGVFATHDVPIGSLLFNKEFELRILKIKDIPKELLQYCIYINDMECLCPERFDRMEIG